MRQFFLSLLLCSSFFLAGCSSASLRFISAGDGALHPEKGAMDALVKSLVKSSSEDAALLLDEAFSLADSLTSANPESEALYWFSESLSERLDGVGSPTRNSRLFGMALDRMQLCRSLEPADWRKINFLRERLALNSPGYAVSDIPVTGMEGDTVSLRSLCRAVSGNTLIFLYGESCRACKDIARELKSSAALAKLAADGSLATIAIYAGDNPREQADMAAMLPGWKHYSDGGTISFGGAFDQREIPSLYLVSRNGIVRVRGERKLSAVLAAARENRTGSVRIPLEEGEEIWGGRVADGRNMPFQDGFSTTLYENSGNQVTPLLLTSKGRYVWSSEPFTFKREGNTLLIENLIDDYETAVVARNLPGAYRFAMRTFFPPEGGFPPEEFFRIPQYNTWIELQYNQNQEGVLQYAQGILEHGLPAGILMIDDTWMEDYGKWEFHPGRFPDPKAMCRRLHSMGFKIMLWITPFMSMDQYALWSQINGLGGFLHTGEGGVYPVLWWNGMSAELDLTNPAAVEWLDGRLRYLRDEYGVDGFKFDAGDFNLFPADAVTAEPSSPWEQSALFMQFADKYPYNEFRASWKGGGKPIVQRLHDKAHSWEALGALVPEMMAANLLGYWYSCPDMIGGGSFASFLPDSPAPDQDLVVRSAQTHALMPMMQFSVAPWRILDKEHLDALLQTAKTRQSHIDYIMKLVQQASETGEPVVAPMEYRFPNKGYARITDQFMLGPDVMVAPMVSPGRSRTVVLPEGKWESDDGRTIEGPCTITENVPLERLPYYRLVK